MTGDPHPETVGRRVRGATLGGAASTARRLVAGATDPRFDTVERAMTQLTDRVEKSERILADALAEVRALRQQVDECLDFLRVDHDIVRDLLEVLRPSLGHDDRA
ncbi:MAG TPA: hypothetical protein VHZ05_14840 [Acidimicrobiales bacterium]|nr:hypothetical protein [Acidimicrobiales bacterium]